MCQQAGASQRISATGANRCTLAGPTSDVGMRISTLDVDGHRRNSIGPSDASGHNPAQFLAGPHPFLAMVKMGGNLSSAPFSPKKTFSAVFLPAGKIHAKEVMMHPVLGHRPSALCQ